MQIAFWIFFAMYAWVVALWALVFPLASRMRMSMVPSDRTAPASTPSVAVYIAAHNEERRIETCLARVLAQPWPDLTVTVVSDRSRDATVERVRGVMARDDRVKLVEVRDLPPGWIGKTHALSVAAAGATADYLLFLDSDCRLESGALPALMGNILRDGIEFATLWPRLELRSHSERFLSPPAIWLLAFWTLLGSWTDRTGVARMGNGQFLLVTREAYRRLGGHASVKAELAEDAVLAYKAAALGLKRWVGSGVGVYVTSRENTWSGTVNAITRVLIGSLVEPWKMAASPHVLMGGVVHPLWILPVGGYFAWTYGWASAWACVAAAVLHLVFMFAGLRRIFDFVLPERGRLWHFPFGALVCIFLTIRAHRVMRGKGTVRWGMSRYSVRGSRIEGAAM